MKIIIDNENTVLGFGTVSVGTQWTDEQGTVRADIVHDGGRLGGANLGVVSIVDEVPDADLSVGSYVYDPESGVVEWPVAQEE